MRYRDYTNDELKKLHEIEIDILDKIVEVCNNNNITYYLAGGTLLGAIRHKGFIPWDDDLDIMMLREDYNKFLKVAQKEMGNEYFVHSIYSDKNYWLPFAKVRKNNTTFRETLDNNKCIHYGIYVDIFPYDYTENPDSKYLKYVAAKEKILTDTMLYKQHFYNKLSNCNYPFLSAIAIPFSYKTIQHMIEKSIKKQNNCKHKYVVSLTGAYYYKKEIFPIDIIKPTIKVDFEGKKYTSFKNYDIYLKSLYGNYMKLPPKKERVNHAPKILDFENGECL